MDPLRRLLPPVALLAVALAGAAAAAAGTDPRLEQERLTRADMTLARHVAVRRADLPSGWTHVPAPAPKVERLSCPGFDPDFSRFTITGRAHSMFRNALGGIVTSSVEVYASRRQAIGDYAVGTAPGALPCVRQLIERQLAAENTGGYEARVVSARTIAAPRVGERRVSYRVVAEVAAGAVAVKLYTDLLVVQKGRSITLVSFIGAFQPLAGQAVVARRVAARMR